MSLITPLENAHAERSFRTLKQAEVYWHDYGTFEEAKTSIGGLIDDVYNQNRLRSAWFFSCTFGGSRAKRRR